MKLIKNILVALDFRDSTENVVANAKLFAQKFNAKVTLVHVLPERIENEKVDALVRQAAEKELHQYQQQFEDLSITTADPVITYGNYSQGIISTSDQVNANLIIIGAGEKPKGDHVQLGTTASRVMAKSEHPVFVVKSEQNLADIKQILCPVDFSEESSNALHNAVAVARLFDAELKVMSVYTPFEQTITRIAPEEVNRQREQDQALELKRFLRHQNLENIKYSQEIMGGKPEEEILKAIDKYPIDLLFMGTTGKSGISKILLGSVAEKVTREVRCSFITSKKEDFLSFEVKKQSLEEDYEAAEKLLDKGFYEQAIMLFKSNLELNFSHIPSLLGLAKAYEKTGQTEKATKYKAMVKNVIDQFQNFKIEEEIRRNI